MKKSFFLLFIMMAALLRGLAQDTITGMVSRIAAPFFEQNVCDSRISFVHQEAAWKFKTRDADKTAMNNIKNIITILTLKLFNHGFKQYFRCFDGW